MASVDVSWTEPTLPAHCKPITNYTVTPAPADVAAVTTPDDTPSVRITGLTEGTNYTFTVVANNADGPSPASAASVAIAAANVPDAPTGLIANPGGTAGTVTLSWTAPVSNHGRTITGYTVLADGGSGYQQVYIGNGTTLAATVSGLTSGTLYSFVVYATNSVGNSANSAVATATPT